MANLVPVSVSHDSDPDAVELALLEVAKNAAVEVPGLMSETEPSVRCIPGFGLLSLDSTFTCHVGR